IVGGAVLVSLLNQEEVDAVDAGGSEYGVAIGDADAPRQVVIYEDFICPHCGELEENSREGLAEAAADGQVLVEYRPFNLLGDQTLPNAFAVVLEESGAEVAKEFHDLLFEHQSEFLEELPSNDRLVELAVEAGAEESDVRPGIEDLAESDWVEDATQEARDSGVSSTPTVILDGEPFTDGGSAAELGQNLVEAVQ
ncbi:MAG TPA: thioredoxin domain-containing protein, partial [Nocardioides sp.]|nr:thioredoxin domain-containing protein [Nocardioides sp.]